MTDPSPTYDIKNGVHCADFVGRDQITHNYGFSAAHVEHLIEKVLGYLKAGAVFLPDPDQPEALCIASDGETLTFRPGAAQQLARQRSQRAYLLALTIDQEYQRWATRFVPLAGKMDIRQVIEGLPLAFSELIIPTGEAGGPITQRPLPSIADAMQTHPSFVILGEPGAGKTTTQQRIAFDAACHLLEGGHGRTPLFVRLSQQGECDPYAFLQSEWERRTGIAFAEALCDGRILILADGINEIPRERRNERLLAWMLFEQQYRGGNQLIFSGREKDYDNQLNLPRVVVEPLDPPRIAEFLQRHQAEGLADLLNDPASRLSEMARNPLNLFVLVYVYLQGGKNLRVLANRGRLFAAFADYLLRHEQQWHPDSLSVDAKVDIFAQLAYQMQQQGVGTTFSLADARRSLPASQTVLGEEIPVDAAALLRFGRGACILDPATLPDVRFYHHLLQEYFAARELLRCFNTGQDLSRLWKAPRLAAEMPETKVGEWDPLPEPPGSGWEVTAILACGLARDPARLIEAVRLVNPILAGRCLDESGSFSPSPDASRGRGPGGGVGGEVEVKVRQDLLSDLYNPAIHLRTRLQAGIMLGKLGDPRFAPTEINDVQVILPQMVSVPTDKYIIGSADNDPEAYDDEKPQHVIELPAFSLGKWPVTNAEYACFMAAGGYTDERWWQTDLAKRWLQGEDVSGGQFKTWLNVWKSLQSMSNVRQQLEQSGNFTPEQIDAYEYVAGLSEDELKEVLSRQLSSKSRQEPAYWQDPRYNNPSQPVVGVTWFEAAAYCAWLSAVSGQPYRLPSEIEWEAAARGLPPSLPGEGVRVYPWGGDFDPAKANTIEGRVLKPSPVGAYTAAGSAGPFGGEDQCGNVWNWTSGLYKPYPYQAATHENPESADERVVRGGAWGYDRGDVRAASRDRDVPDYFSYFTGFRVSSPG